MFVQVIRGRTENADEVTRLGEAWRDEVAPGADGFLGATTGVTADGEVVAIVRFADEASARRNSERPEQDAWWQEMVRLYDGGPTFVESGDVDQMTNGDPDDATFVQVMEGTIADLASIRSFEQAAQDSLWEMRPDLLGLFRVNHPDGRFTAAAYFRSESEARTYEAGEAQNMPPEIAEGFAAYQQNMATERFLDLVDPQLY